MRLFKKTYRREINKIFLENLFDEKSSSCFSTQEKKIIIKRIIENFGGYDKLDALIEEGIASGTTFEKQKKLLAHMIKSA